MEGDEGSKINLSTVPLLQRQLAESTALYTVKEKKKKNQRNFKTQVVVQLARGLKTVLFGKTS